MAKAISHKRANHRKTRAHAHQTHRAAKPHARRPSETRSSALGGTSSSATAGDPEPEFFDDESAPQREPRRLSDEESDDEFSIYGPGRGETAG